MDRAAGRPLAGRGELRQQPVLDRGAGRTGLLDQTGGVGLGVSGSGDVRSGIVTGLAARGADPAQAAVWGTFLHGRAGDRLAARVGRLGFLARELLPEVPRALAEVET